MEEDVQNALRSQAAYMPGGHDRDAHNLIVVPVPQELQPWTKPQLETCLNYIFGSLRSETKSNGFTVILDAQKCSWRVTRAHIRYLGSCMPNHLRRHLLVIRPDTFWDTQQVVDHCAKTQKNGEPIILSKARLHKYFDADDLPTCLGGTIPYDHDQWISNRIRFEEFKVLHERASNDLENLHLLLLDNKAARAEETEQALRTCARLNGDVKLSLDATLTNGNQLISLVEEQHRRQRIISPDIIDLAQNIRDMLKELETKQTNVTLAWVELEKSIQTARELSILEEGVTFVTNWILSTADSLLNDQNKVGYDVKTSEDLRMQHDTVEMQCLETYGFYAELLHKINVLPIPKDSYSHSDLMSQKDFMDFVCWSFATRLERRRNVLITSLRFFRLVSEYFDKTSEAFDSLILANKMPDFDKAPKLLKKLKATQHNLETTESKLIKEGEKLSDMLAMPVKDALGCDVKLDYSDDIINIRDIMDATITRKNIFIDSMELQKLTLQQLIHIKSYEEDLATTITWLTDLYNVLIKCHLYVGVHIGELQHQKDELQTFLDTSKEIYGYGCHLLEGSFSLRQSCKLSVEPSEEFGTKLKNCWKKLQDISQEQLTRLRVSAVFHRSIDDYSAKLIDLRTSVTAITHDTGDTMATYEEEERELIFKKYLTHRERLLVDVGRTVRLGRLLKTRLKETLSFDDDHSESTSSDTMATNKTVVLDPDNSVACEAITAKLNQVAQIAETLDSSLMEAGVLCKSVEALVVTETDQVDETAKLITTTSNANISDEARSSSDQESAVTAPLWNPQSRSSSYHTASECRSSPWWDSEKNSDLEVEPSRNIRRLRAAGTSSASNSFDDSDQSLMSTSFRSPVSMVVVDDFDDQSIKVVSKEPSIDEEDSSSTISQHSRKGSVIRIEEVSPETITDPATDYLVDGATAKVSADANQQPDFMAWNLYYQNLINKQTIRSCL